MTRMHRLTILLYACLALCGYAQGPADRIAEATGPLRRLPLETYLDKAAGAWAGQMIGVCYGAPYEFQSNAQPIAKPLEPWTPGRVGGAPGQDDLYVELTFLEALLEHGLDIAPVQAGRAFAVTEYGLCHANRAGRDNLRRGLDPPLSGHPDYNRHADDIDFQIEADLFGIICPGLPQESNRLCDVFGHIMNYGDGVYGGMFVAGMYAAAYFEGRDVKRVVEAGLACLPAESRYARCVRDVIAWHEEAPDDWLATWHKIEEVWQDDVDCVPGKPMNIDAVINGAYIVMGLLYGQGDFERTMEISTRCGQDADCNPSNAAGVLGCMKGFSALEPRFTSGIPAIATAPFSHSRFSFESLVPACRQLTEQIVVRSGGTVDGAALHVPHQAPVAAPLEQWAREDKRRAVQTPDESYGKEPPAAGE